MEDSFKIELAIRDMDADYETDVLRSMAEPNEEGVLCVLVVECE